jgi:hypothetical protein
MFAIPREYGNHYGQRDTLSYARHRSHQAIAASVRLVAIIQLVRWDVIHAVKTDDSATTVCACGVSMSRNTDAKSASTENCETAHACAERRGISITCMDARTRGGKLPSLANACCTCACASARFARILVQLCYVGSQCEYDAGNTETRSNQIRGEEGGEGKLAPHSPIKFLATLKHGTLRGTELPCLAGFNGASITLLITSCCRRLQSA